MKKRLLCALGAAAIMATAVPTAFAADIPQTPTPQSSSIYPHESVAPLCGEVSSLSVLCGFFNEPSESPPLCNILV